MWAVVSMLLVCAALVGLPVAAKAKNRRQLVAMTREAEALRAPFMAAAEEEVERMFAPPTQVRVALPARAPVAYLSPTVGEVMTVGRMRVEAKKCPRGWVPDGSGIPGRYVRLVNPPGT